MKEEKRIGCGPAIGIGLGYLAVTIAVAALLFSQDNPFVGFGGLLVLLIGGGVLFTQLIKRLGKKPEAPAAPEQVKAAVTPPTEEELAAIRKRMAAMVPKSAADKQGWYDLEYTGVGVFRPKDVAAPMPPIGDELRAVPEPSNAYDPDAVALKNSAGETVGYLNKGKIRNAVRRGLDERAPMSVLVSRSDDKLEVYIGVDKMESEEDLDW